MGYCPPTFTWLRALTHLYVKLAQRKVEIKYDKNTLCLYSPSSLL